MEGETTLQQKQQEQGQGEEQDQDQEQEQEQEEKARLIAQVRIYPLTSCYLSPASFLLPPKVLELQNTLEELSCRVDGVKEENMRLRSENQASIRVRWGERGGEREKLDGVGPVDNRPSAE